MVVVAGGGGGLDLVSLVAGVSWWCGALDPGGCLFGVVAGLAEALGVEAGGFAKLYVLSIIPSVSTKPIILLPRKK